MSEQFLVGVDGGGSQTRAVVCNPAGEVLGWGAAGSSNFYAVGLDETATNIAAAIRGALADLNATGLYEPEREAPALQSCGLGLAGACSPADISALRAALLPALAPFFADKSFPVAIDEDAVAAWAGAFDGEAGIICIAGTGANAFGIGTDGTRVKVDGVGPLLGDRGSGIDIGRGVLRAAAAAYDGAGRTTSLFEASLAHFGLGSMDELVAYIYAPGFARSELAGLVPVAARTAEAGDFVAQDILNHAGFQLATSVAAVIRKLALAPDRPVPVAPVGGVLENVSLVRASFERELAALAAHPVVVQAPRCEAVVGAAFLPRIFSS